MNIKWVWLILIPIILVIIGVAVFLYYRSQASLLNIDLNADDNSIAIIGGTSLSKAYILIDRFSEDGHILDIDKRWLPEDIKVDDIFDFNVEVVRNGK